MNSKGLSTPRSIKSKHIAGRVVTTDLGFDLARAVEELDKQVIKNAVDKIGTLVRKAAVAKLKKGSSDSNLGMSKYGKMTRGDWKNPRVTKEARVDYSGRSVISRVGGVNYLPGGWYGKVLDRRGKDKPSMAKNGGRNGRRGIISKPLKRRRGGWYSMTGPVYGTDDKDNSKFGHNHAHVHEGVNGPAKHKAWNKKAGTLKVRPFLGPAGRDTAAEQKKVLVDTLGVWLR